MLICEDRVKGGLYGGAVGSTVLGVLVAETQRNTNEGHAVLTSGGSPGPWGGPALWTVNSIINNALTLILLARTNPNVARALALGFIIGGAAGSEYQEVTFDLYDKKSCGTEFQDDGMNITVGSPETELSGSCYEHLSCGCGF